MLKLRNIIVYSRVYFISIICSHAQQPRLVVPVGHPGTVIDAVFSPDSKTIATYAEDNTIKIWSVVNGKLLQTLRGNTGYFIGCRFSEDGKYISTIDTDTIGRIWNIQTGRLMSTYPTNPHSVLTVPAIFSYDSKLVVISTMDGLHIIRTDNWDTVFHIRAKGDNETTGIPMAYTFSNDDKILAVNFLGLDSLFMWRVPSGKLLGKQKISGGDFIRLAFSNDNKRIILYDTHILGILDLATGKQKNYFRTPDEVKQPVTKQNGDLLYRLESRSKFISSRYGNASVLTTRESILSVNPFSFEITTGKRSDIRVDSLPAGARSVEFSNDGRFFGIAADNGVKILSLQGNRLKEIANLPAPPASSQYSYMQSSETWMHFSPDNRYIVSSSLADNISIWDLKGNLRHVLSGSITYDNDPYFDSHGQFIYTDAGRKNNTGWDLFAGKFVDGQHYFIKDSLEVIQTQAIKLSPSFDRRSNKWILKNGDKILPLQDYPDSLVNNGWLSPGKKTIVTTGENDSLVRTWDPHSGKLTNTFKNECKIRKRLVFDPRGNWVVFTNNRFASTDGSDEMWKNLEKELNSPVSDAKDTLNAKDAAGTNELITPVTDSSWDFKIVDLLSGNTIFKVQDESDFLSTPAFSDSSKYFMLYSASSVRVWDTRSWRTVLVLDLNNEYDDATVNINHAGTNALVTSNYSTTLFETRSNKRLFTLPDVVDNASFSADDQYILTTSPDMQLKIWDARNGKMLFTYYAFENNDYLVLDEFGRYDGTEKARKNLYYVCGDEIIDLEQFKDLGWEPKLAAKIMGTDKEPITAKKISEINICNVTPVVEEKGMSNGNYQYQITPRSGGLGEVQLYIKVDNNEKLIKRYDPNAFPKVGNASVLFIKPESIRDFLVSGTINGLNVKATTKDGTMTSRGTTVGVISETREVKNPDVYLVSIGISQYKADKLKLAYASKDATDFSSALALSAKKLLNTDGKEHVTSYTFSTSEGSQYWPSKQAIIKTLDSISKKATADDIFVIFFAGHGVMKSGQKNLYLLTAEATAFEMEGVEKEVAISFDELKIWMQKIKANKQLVILDACNSGQAVQNLKQLFTKRDVPADQQRALEDLKDKTGTYIISASASGQSAYETSLYGQGLLTYSLLSAIKLGDGLKDNKYIDVTKWFNTAAGNVKTMAQDIGGRQDPQIIGNASFNVGLVDKEVTDEIKLSIKKKVFRRSTLVREGPMPSDNLLGLSALVDKALNEVSSRGKESPLTYIPDNTLLDAYSIVGSYKAVGNDVTIKIFLLKGEQEDKPLFQTELIGTVDKKELLAQKIVVEIQRFLNQ